MAAARSPEDGTLSVPGGKRSTETAEAAGGPWRARPRLDAALGRLLGRWSGRAPGGETGRAAPAASAPAPILMGSPLAERRPILTVLWGLAPDIRLAVVDRIMASSPADLLPVFVLDTTDFEPLRHRRALFEHLPPAADRRARWPGPDWDLYTARRFVLLCWKWQPLRVVAFGAAAHAQLAAWRGSPLLPTEVQDLLAAEPDAAAGDDAGS